MNEWMNEWMHEWMNEWMKKKKSIELKWNETKWNEWMDERKKRSKMTCTWNGTDEWMNEECNEWMNKWMNEMEWMNECMNECMNEWMNDWMNEWNWMKWNEMKWKKSMNEWMIEWLNDWMMEWMNKWHQYWNFNPYIINVIELFLRLSSHWLRTCVGLWRAMALQGPRPWHKGLRLPRVLLPVPVALRVLLKTTQTVSDPVRLC